MDVTIIGTGNIGKTLAARILAGGHKVTLVGTEAPGLLPMVVQEGTGFARTIEVLP